MLVQCIMYLGLRTLNMILFLLFFSIEYIKKTYFDVFLCFFGVDSSI